ncbi:hypothetical protein ANN_04864 [Periplaneta americana]|uniref:Uncharacterized protein n=1 Tax=Periplaneta americana TaxID=6978 RepID=A0ABQ8TBD3_PERAM|nr:hypothetical protein ANN_04864 [Periplaneta americana]
MHRRAEERGRKHTRQQPRCTLVHLLSRSGTVEIALSCTSREPSSNLYPVRTPCRWPAWLRRTAQSSDSQTDAEDTIPRLCTWVVQLLGKMERSPMAKNVHRKPAATVELLRSLKQYCVSNLGKTHGRRENIEAGAAASFSTPGKSRPKKKIVEAVDNFYEEVIRKLIYCYATHKQGPTLKSLLPIVYENKFLRRENIVKTDPVEAGIQWLDSHGIRYADDATKIELIEVVKLHKASTDRSSDSDGEEEHEDGITSILPLLSDSE